MTIRYHRNSAGFRIDYFCREYAGRTALTCCGEYRQRRFTYETLFSHSVQTAALLLDLGCRKGDSVLLCAKNCAETAAVIFAGGLLGLKIIPVDVQLPPSAVSRMISAVQPRVVVTSRKDLDAYTSEKLFVDLLFETAAAHPKNLDGLFARFPEVEWYVDETDTYLEIFTSGTTSAPKSVPLTHRNLISNVGNLKNMCEVPESYTVLSTAPLSHALGLTLGLFGILAYGAHVVLVQSLDSETLRRALDRNRIDGIVTVPALLQIFKEKIESAATAEGKQERFERALNRAKRMPMWMRRRLFSKVRRVLGRRLSWIVTGAAPLPREVGEFYEALGIRVTEGYGLTEALMVCVSDFSWRKLGTVGRCLKGQELRLDENNEIWIAGPNVFSGYNGSGAADVKLFRDGWMRTGDIGRIDEQGRLTIVGRAKNVIIGPSGLNIYPEDMEAELRRDSRVKECVVLNAPRREGELYLVAAVLLSGVESEEALEEIRRAVNARLGTRQPVAALVRWPESDFPRTASAKVRRGEVEAQIAEQMQTLCGRRVTTVSRSVVERKSVQTTSLDEAVCRIVASVGRIDIADVGPDARLVADLGLDSLGLMEITARLGAELSTEVPREKIFGSDLSVRELTALVEGDGEGTEGSQGTGGTAPVYRPCLIVRGVLAASRRVSVDLAPVLFRMFFALRIRGRSLRRPISAAAKKQGHILIANHASHLDTPTIFSALPRSMRKRFTAAAAQDHFFDPAHKSRYLLFSSALRLLPTDRTGDPRNLYKTVGEALDRGESVLVFPEGTRSRSGELGTFHPSIGRMIQELRAPVIPLFLRGTHELLPPGATAPKPGRIVVELHEPVSFSPNLSPYQVRDQLADLFQARVA